MDWRELTEPDEDDYEFELDVMHLPPDVDDELTVEIAHCHNPMLSSPPFRNDGPSTNAPQGCGDEEESDGAVGVSHIAQGEALQQIFAKQRETILKDQIITDDHLRIMRGWHAQDAEMRKQEKIKKNLRFKNARMRKR
ncbi:hypothetical protein FRB97_003007 [Tulasnella sp. 331]|nr:hypothetical protein FRB97_003007 [Tulasnella sp. 331]KAG8891126.1 hypothetical protein FRB98_000135 [Tulasnella sp. 332]